MIRTALAVRHEIASFRILPLCRPWSYGLGRRTWALGCSAWVRWTNGGGCRSTSTRGSVSPIRPARRAIAITPCSGWRDFCSGMAARVCCTTMRATSRRRRKSCPIKPATGLLFIRQPFCSRRSALSFAPLVAGYYGFCLAATGVSVLLLRRAGIAWWCIAVGLTGPAAMWNSLSRAVRFALRCAAGGGAVGRGNPAGTRRRFAGDAVH